MVYRENAVRKLLRSHSSLWHQSVVHIKNNTETKTETQTSFLWSWVSTPRLHHW